ncbi:hypothetical protein [Pseudomonas putida]|uniref:hypothetical protein n=1 Tax=Pseudomonas putida TaxID=303 RepID=UPI003F88CC40
MNILKFLKNPFQGAAPTPASIIDKWSSHHQQYFFNKDGKQLEWTTAYGQAALYYLPDTHGYSTMPDMVCRCSAGGYSIDIGWLEGVIMYGGGIARVKHFALNTGLTRRGLGRSFLESILYFLKAQNATRVEFHESHSTKIQHYRAFFSKMGIAEVTSGVWGVDLYPGSAIPKPVVDYQASLIKAD